MGHSYFRFLVAILLFLDHELDAYCNNSGIKSVDIPEMDEPKNY